MLEDDRPMSLAADVKLPRQRSKLAKARLSQGLSQAAVAGRLGKSVSWLSAVETGLIVPTLNQRIAIGQVMGLPVALLFDEDADEEGMD